MSMICDLNYKFINNQTDTVLVFLHGWGLSYNCWQNVVNKYNKKYSILLVDFFGFGNSGMPKNYYDTYEYSYWLYVLLKKLQINSVVVVGHSFGGRISILLSGVFDINLKGLVLTSSAGINKFNIKTFLRIRKYKFIKWLLRIGILKNNKILKTYGSYDYKNSSGELRNVLSRVVRQDLRRFVIKSPKYNVYLFWDKKDKDTEYFICKKLHKMICSSRIVLCKTGGHFCAFHNINKFINVINKL